MSKAENPWCRPATARFLARRHYANKKLREARVVGLLQRSGVKRFTGTESHFQHWTRRLIYTDGIEYLAERAGAYWLIDAIASYQGTRRMNPRLMEFQLWELKVTAKDGRRCAVLTCREDSGEPARITQRIEYTDFPLDAIKLYVENGTLMLPSER